MARVAPQQTSFGRGRLTRRLHGKQDLEMYYSGLRDAVNYVVTGHAILEKRPGYQYLGQTKNNQDAALIPFVFDPVTSYQLEVGHEYFRAWFDDGLVLDAGVPSETVTPYDSADVHDLSTAQINDFMVVTHGSYPQSKITRTSTTTFAFDDFDTRDGPYEDVNADQSKTLAISATGVSPNVGRVSFSDGDAGTVVDVPSDMVVGSEIRTLVDGVLETLTVTSIDTANNRCETDWDGPPISSTTQWSYDGKAGGTDVAISVEGVSGITTGTVTAVGHTPFDAGRDVGRWVRILEEDESAPSSAPLEDRFQWHSAKITAVTDSSNATIEWDGGNVPASTDWRLGAFYPGSRPQVCVFHDNRLWFGLRDRLYGSSAGDFDNFAPTDVDSSVNPDNAITVQIPAISSKKGATSEISYLMSLGSQLLIGTPSGLHTLQNTTLGKSITPGEEHRQLQDSRGAARVNPIIIGDSVLFAHASKKKLMGTYPRDNIDKIGARDVSLSADDLTQKRIKGIVWQEEPYSIAWLWFEDGSLAGFTLQPEEKVQAWHPHQIGGTLDLGGIITPPKVCSMGVQPSPGGGDDRLYAIIHRTIGSNTVRTVERMTEFRDVTLEGKTDLRDAWYLDAALKYEGNADQSKTITFTGSGIDARSAVTTFTDPAFTDGQTLTFHDGARWHHGVISGVDADNNFTWTPSYPNAGPGPADGRWHYVEDEWVQLAADSAIDIFSQTYQEPVTQAGIWRWSQGVTSVSGFDDFNNSKVRGMCNGFATEDLTVQDGKVSGLADCHVALIGQPYAAKGALLPIEAGAQNGSAQNKQRPVYEVAILVDESLGLESGTGMPSAYDGVWEHFDPPANTGESHEMLVGEPPDAVSGWLRFNRDEQYLIDDPRVAWRSADPYPSTILAVIPRTTQSDGR